MEGDNVNLLQLLETGMISSAVANDQKQKEDQCKEDQQQQQQQQMLIENPVSRTSFFATHLRNTIVDLPSDDKVRSCQEDTFWQLFRSRFPLRLAYKMTKTHVHYRDYVNNIDEDAKNRVARYTVELLDIYPDTVQMNAEKTEIINKEGRIFVFFSFIFFFLMDVCCVLH